MGGEEGEQQQHGEGVKGRGRDSSEGIGGKGHDRGSRLSVAVSLNGFDLVIDSFGDGFNEVNAAENRVHSVAWLFRRRISETAGDT